MRIVARLSGRVLAAHLLLAISAAMVLASAVQWEFDDPTSGALVASAHLADALDQDADGRPVLRESAGVARYMAAPGSFWYLVRGRDGAIEAGAVPPAARRVLADLGPAMSGQFVVTDAALGGPFAFTSAGGMQILAGGFATTPADLLDFLSGILSEQFGAVAALSALATLLAVGTAAGSVERVLGALRPLSERDWTREGALSVVGLPAELRPFAESFNAALGRLREASERIDRSALEIAHELQGPVSSLLMQVSALPRGPAKATLEAELRGLAALIESLLKLARSLGDVDPVEVDLAALVRTLCLDRAPFAVRSGRRLALEAGSGPVVVRSEPALLSVAIGNVLDNALRHTRAGDEIVVRLDAAGTLVIDDNGPGLPPGFFGSDIRAFRRAGGTAGTGLGLSLAATIVQRLGGAVRFEKAERGGLRVTITLG